MNATQLFWVLSPCIRLRGYQFWDERVVFMLKTDFSVNMEPHPIRTYQISLPPQGLQISDFLTNIAVGFLNASSQNLE
jgi:hypothetical protein